MREAIIHSLESIPPELATTIVSALPIFELRGGIPLALLTYDLSIPSALFFSLLGNIIPGLIILWWIGPIAKWLSKHSKTFDKFFTWLFERTREKFYHRHEKWGDIALITFVAIPFPLTGVYTGALAAFLFGIPFRRAFPLLLIGMLIAATIVTLLTLLA